LKLFPKKFDQKIKGEKMIYVCNHCGTKVTNNGGSCYEIGMIYVDKKYYCDACAKSIALELLELV